MSERIRPWLRVAVTALAIAAYATLAHFCNTRSAPRSLGALVAALPPLFLAGALAWRMPQRAVALACVAALAALIVVSWPRLREHFSAVMMWEQFGSWSLLSANFAVTLLPGRESLCTRWADRVHGPLTAEVVRYTRRVTAAWASFFALMGTLSVALYFLARIEIWSAFENFLVLPLVAVGFLAEYLVRRAVLPQLRHVGILEAVRSYSSHR
jgi:uncharacterized membrane protein